MGGTKFYIGFNTSGSASTNINMRNAGLKATTEIHVFIDFSCAANLGGGPVFKRVVKCSGGPY